jgi:hypothetical protein
MKILKMFLNAYLGPLKIYVFRMFQKFHSSNQLKYLMVVFSKEGQKLARALLFFFFLVRVARVSMVLSGRPVMKFLTAIAATTLVLIG